MSDQQQHLEEVKQFLQEHRNNETHFEKLYARLEEECNRAHDGELQTYVDSLQEVKEKQAEAYRQSRETGGTAWLEFEKFASGFEKAVTAAEKELGKTDQ
jgi:hypothetical protein